MNACWQQNGITVYCGHALDVLRELPAESVDCVATSPPYWGLRDYGLPPIEWPAVSYAPMPGLAEVKVPGCEPDCEHYWVDSSYRPAGHSDDGETSSGLEGGKATQAQSQRSVIHQAYCNFCGGWRGCLGLEPDPSTYVGHLVLIFREIWRVMKPQATCWLNLGDSYASRPQTDNFADPKAPRRVPDGRCRTTALKSKDLVGIPWRVAFALQAEGWYLRSDIIWAKKNCMPESIRDRPTKAHEYLFLLAKQERYYYDDVAVAESSTGQNGQAANFARGTKEDDMPCQAKRQHREDRKATNDNGTRHRRSVWTIATARYKKAHFATFPPALVELCVKAGTSERGHCPKCGKAWERVVEHKNAVIKLSQRAIDKRAMGLSTAIHGKQVEPASSVTTGWRPDCKCGLEPTPGVVLDPFCGSGTVMEVALKLGRHAVGIELSETYCRDHIVPRLEKYLC